MTRLAVVLFNLGGPDSLAAVVQRPGDHRPADAAALAAGEADLEAPGADGARHLRRARRQLATAG
jgi:hypothetical protein